MRRHEVLFVIEIESGSQTKNNITEKETEIKLLNSTFNQWTFYFLSVSFFFMITRAFESESSFKKSPLVLIPVPWAATASYGLGTDQAPLLIRKASEQLDFFSPLFKCSYNDKIHFLKEDALISSLK